MEYCPKDGTQSLKKIDSMHIGVDGLARRAAERAESQASQALNQGAGAGSDVRPGNEDASQQPAKRDAGS